MMNTNKPKCSAIFSALVISSLLAIAGSIGGLTNFQALGWQKLRNEQENIQLDLKS
jgi:hypothetical protein